MFTPIFIVERKLLALGTPLKHGFMNPCYPVRSVEAHIRDKQFSRTKDEMKELEVSHLKILST